MTEKIYSIDEIRTTISPIARRYGVGKVYLFGSYARGEAKENIDIDLRIDKGNLRGLFALSGLRIDISEALSKDVDLLTTKSLDDDFKNELRNYEVLIYEQGQ